MPWPTVLALAFLLGAVVGLFAARRTSIRVLPAAAECALATAAGTGLGMATGWLVGGTIGATVGATISGANALFCSAQAVYDWRSARGWFAFLADSTWAIVTTGLGLLLLTLNTIRRDAEPVRDLSHRRNQHVHQSGFALKHGFVLTLGNVMSNAGQSERRLNPRFLTRHEELHIWQSRIFGPLYPLVYLVWGALGVVVGTAVWLAHREVPWMALVETAAYYNNPFEYWAYRNDEYWPPKSAHPLLAWRGPRGEGDDPEEMLGEIRKPSASHSEGMHGATRKPTVPHPEGMHGSVSKPSVSHPEGMHENSRRSAPGERSEPRG